MPLERKVPMKGEVA